MRGLLILLSLWGVVAFAQSRPAPPPAATNATQRVNVNFSLFIWPTTGVLHKDAKLPAVPPVYYASPSGTNRIHLARGNASPMYPYGGPLPLELFDVKKQELPPPTDAPANTPPTILEYRVPYIRADFPSDWTEVILVVFPGRVQPDGTVLTLPMPYNMRELPPGYVRMYNGTKHRFVLEINEQTVVFPPYQYVDFHPDRLSDQGYLRVTVYGKDRHGSAAPVYSRKIRVSDATNNYYFVYPQGTNRIRMMHVGGHALPTEP